MGGEISGSSWLDIALDSQSARDALGDTLIEVVVVEGVQELYNPGNIPKVDIHLRGEGIHLRQFDVRVGDFTARYIFIKLHDLIQRGKFAAVHVGGRVAQVA